jgi:hypothetical protein
MTMPKKTESIKISLWRAFIGINYFYFDRFEIFIKNMIFTQSQQRKPRRTQRLNTAIILLRSLPAGRQVCVKLGVLCVNY